MILLALPWIGWVLAPSFAIAAAPAPQQDERTQSERSAVAREQQAPWRRRSGLELLSAADRGFVEKLDQAWSSGHPENVLDLFDFLHPQARQALAARVMMTSSGRPMRRSSKILAAREDRDASGRRLVGLWLSVDLETSPNRWRGRGPREENDPPAKLGDDEELFELLVLRTGEERSEGRVLLQTTRNWQLHVQARDWKKPEMAAEALGRDLCFRCPVCNYEVGSPGMGSWVVLARPSFLSACIEAVDVLSLDEDLALELSVHPKGRRSPAELASWLERSARLLAASIGKLHRAPGAPERLEFGGAAGFKLEFEVKQDGGPLRVFLLHALQHGDATYLCAIQTSPELRREHPEKLRELLETFHVMDRQKPVTKERLLEVFGGPGRFAADGAHFELEKLGVLLPGFPGWRHERSLGLGAFHAHWTDPDTGALLRVVGVHRPSGNWSPRAVVRYLAQLVDRNRSPLSPRPEFRATSKLERHSMRTKSGATRDCYALRFEYTACDQLRAALGPGKENVRGTCKGFVRAIPLGRLLLLVAGETMPGPQQEQIYDAMVEKADGLRIR